MRKPRLNPKQALFVKNYTSRQSKTFGNAMQSAIDAGFSPSYAAKITAVLSENVRESMAEALDEAGMSDAQLADKHAELLNKREVVVIRDGKESHAELTDQPDAQAVKAALDMAYKIKGHYAAEKLEHSGKDGKPLSLVFVKDQTELPPEDDAAPDRQT